MLADPAEIAKLAASKSPAVQGQLTIAIAQTCAARDMGDTDAGRFINTILTELARRVEFDVRLKLAAQLAQVAWAPHDLIFLLANDDIDIAKHVIEHSAVLLDSDLITVARDGTVDHRVSIASRPDVAELVCDALAGFGEPTVLHAMLENKTSNMSRPALLACLDAATSFEPICTPLARRSQLPNDIVDQLYRLVSEELRSELAERFQFDVAKKQALADACAKAAKPAPVSEADGAATLVAKLAAAGKLSPSFIVKAAAQGQFYVFVHAVATATEVDPAHIKSVLTSGGAWSVALMCRASGIERSAFSSVLKACSDFGWTPQTLPGDSSRDTGNAFVNLTRDGAADTLRRLASAD